MSCSIVISVNIAKPWNQGQIRPPLPAEHDLSYLARANGVQEDQARRQRGQAMAQFVGNPHIAAATKKDYMLQLKPIQATFPEPLPPYLPRSSKLPASLPPATDFNSANAGRFSLGLRGMRRDLRSAGSRAQHLVQAIEAELLCWLDAISVELNPDDARSIDYSTKHPIANIDSIFEVARTSHQLIWHIPEDAFARYVVHCCARFHNVVSFSKESSGSRLTFLLRPNVTRPNRQATAALDTPPTTDLDNSSRFDSDSELNCLVASDSPMQSPSFPATRASEPVITSQTSTNDPLMATLGLLLEIQRPTPMPTSLHRRTLWIIIIPSIPCPLGQSLTILTVPWRPSPSYFQAQFDTLAVPPL
ncbi:hypothetical protein D9757_004289 [Collybiopsis confluens]|uniref:R3H-associated N-terminal domain-containing protein n=1 Tax=Collybiopsis confluens TaxID=2823264 RepID=A0A8H5HTS8_9AGAR|nr:hypothetical protein D9757_004289 [Collybiopsis confluens]